MRRLPLLLLPCILAGLLGCPLDEKGDYKFISADTSAGGPGGLFDVLAEGGADEAPPQDDGNAASRTVVEPDVIRLDGDLLYILNQYRGLTIVDLVTETILAQVPIRGLPRDLYIDSGRAYVLVGYARDYVAEDGRVVGSAADSRLYIVNVTVPEEAEVASAIDLEGNLVDSRLVGDILYAVTARYEYSYYGWDGGGGIPIVVEVTEPGRDPDQGGESVEGSEGTGATGPSEDPASGGDGDDGQVAPGDDGSTPDGSEEPEPDVIGDDGQLVPDGGGVSTSETVVTSIDVSDPMAAEVVQELRFPGSGHVIQVTSSAVFVASNSADWNNTEIAYVDIGDPGGAMVLVDELPVRGQVADRFKMDVWQGVLRVVSTSWEETRQVYVTTYDLASLERLAEAPIEAAAGETLFATRFDGPRAYIVTFLVVDPLFVLDLSDPRDPKVLGDLKVPGYFTHIEARGDVLVALGVDDTDGGRRVKVSLIDVSGPPEDPVALIDSVSFGDEWAWSSAFSDVKAFTVLDDVIIVPFSGWTNDYGGFERLQFIAWTPQGLTRHDDVDLDGAVLRSFRSETQASEYYAVTSEQLARIDATDLDNLEVASTLTIAEYVADYAEVSSEVGVQIISRFDDATTVLRTVDAEGRTLGEISLDLGAYQALHVLDSKVAVVGVAWDETAQYRVALVDVAAPAAPERQWIQSVVVEPYFNYYGYYDYAYGAEPAIAEDNIVRASFMYPYFGTGGESTFLLDTKLALRCFADSFQVTYGEEASREGLALIDLAEGPQVTTVGLGFDRIVSLDAVGSMLYIGTKVDIASFDTLPVCAYFIRELDVLGGAVGAAANVPGAFLAYNPASQILTLRNYLWDIAGRVENNLETVLWSGAGAVTPVDSLTLPEGAGTLIATEAAVFFDAYTYDEYWALEYALHAVTVDAGGGLDLGEGVAVADEWGQLLGARGSSAFVSVGGSVLARYGSTQGGVLVLEDLIEVVGTPNRLRFGEDRVYLPLGYWGLASMRL